ncbi:MAG: glycosyltransferase family 2 protein [Burkholderiales bacterium]|nr:glycosyltransferase family 2 protein [Burkholderiales bacterium]
MNQPSRAPKVSVCVITYNQEAFIGQCLQSLVDQQTDFDFEVIVGDDCSTDGTQAIVRQFADRHPNIVRPIFQPSNTGGNGNYLAVHGAAFGEYIAHMDGDDYALPGKLQAQADLLDQNPACNVVWHAVDMLEPSGTVRPSRQVRHGRSRLWFTKADQINYLVIAAHSSKMYRASVREFVAPTSGFTDFFLTVAQLEGGGGALLCDRAYGVCRLGIGLSSSGFSTRRVMLSSLQHILSTEPRYRDEVAAATLHLLLSDVKRRAPTLGQSLRLFLSSVSVGAIALYLRSYRQRTHLKF